MFEPYYNDLLNYMVHVTGNRDTAADIVQESYARLLAWQAPTATGIAVDAPRALLFRTAKNLVVDQHRKAVVRGQEEDIDQLEMCCPDSCNPETVVAGQQQVHVLLQTIGALPPRCREAFVLHKREGMPQAKIAAHMGISRSMVEKHVVTGMLACKTCLNVLEMH